MSYYGYVAPQDGFPRARAAAERAIALAPDIADAHVPIGLERLFWARDWPNALREMERAIELNPKLAIARSFYALVLVTCGRCDEALAEARRAIELDPLSSVVNMGVAWVQHFSGNHDEALKEALRTRALAPNFDEAGNVILEFVRSARPIRGGRAHRVGATVLGSLARRFAAPRRVPRGWATGVLAASVSS